MKTKKSILVLNCGSSSIKFNVICLKTEDFLLKGIAENLNAANPIISISLPEKNIYKDHKLDANNYEFAINFIVDTLKKYPEILETIVGVGHRVVHGGEQFSKSVRISNEVQNAIKECITLAPLHNPANLLGIELAKKAFHKLEHVAVFDTAFHQTMPKEAYLYGTPYNWYKDYKVRRYGFHGTSHKYVTMQAAKYLNKPIKNLSLISAHLGNGGSVCAVKHGLSVDTTMGLTPLEGIMMGTRSGDVDPSLPIYMKNIANLEFEECVNDLNKKSGLLGVSGISMDLRTLEQEASNNNTQAILAINLYCYKLAKHIASMIVPLGGLDALIFTGGIGENSNLIRYKTVEYLKYLNLLIDENKNNNVKRGAFAEINNDKVKNTPKILVIPTNEELMIAKDTFNLIKEELE